MSRPRLIFWGFFFSPLISPIIKQVKQKRSPERNDLAQEWGRPVFFLNNNNNKKGYIHIQMVVGEEREPVDAEPSVAKDTTRKICGGACAISSRSYTFRPPLLDIILYIEYFSLFSTVVVVVVAGERKDSTRPAQFKVACFFPSSTPPTFSLSLSPLLLPHHPSIGREREREREEKKLFSFSLSPFCVVVSRPLPSLRRRP
jgi:hypothetical protein